MIIVAISQSVVGRIRQDCNICRRAVECGQRPYNHIYSQRGRFLKDPKSRRKYNGHPEKERSKFGFPRPQSPSPAAGGAVSIKMKFSQISKASFSCYSTILLFLYVVTLLNLLNLRRYFFLQIPLEFLIQTIMSFAKRDRFNFISSFNICMTIIFFPYCTGQNFQHYVESGTLYIWELCRHS